MNVSVYKTKESQCFLRATCKVTCFSKISSEDDINN